jgi:hypothetical protein
MTDACPINEIAIGGGWSFAIPQQFLPHDWAPQVYESDLFNGGWRVQFVAFVPVTATIFAECLGNAAAPVSVQSQTYDIRAQESDHISSASCPGGSTLLGGGFDYKGGHYELLDSYGGGNAWFVTTSNLSSLFFPAGLTDFAVCYGSSRPQTQHNGTQVDAHPGDNATATVVASCDAGWTVVAGGFARYSTTSLVLTDAPIDGLQWKVLVFDNQVAGAPDLHAYVNCVQF